MFPVLMIATALGGTPLDSAALTQYADLLEKHVKSGKVNYAGMREDVAQLDNFLAAVAKAKPGKGSNAIAFYIDAYNASVVRSVIAHRIPKSVRDVKDFFKEKKHTVAGKTISLDELEKSILLPLAKDPRLHMVLVCAARGCPPLEGKPYSGSKLERRLETATERYVRSSAGARPAKGTLGLSKIFEWYAKDFGGTDGVVAFVKKRLQDENRAKLGNSPKIFYFNYDWTLNRR